MFRHHFGHREHLYGVLLAEMADDLEAGGPTAEICRDHRQAARADAIQLRLLAGIFRIVLRREAPELALFYPTLGGAADPSGAWPALRPLLESHIEELRDALYVVPQTNEVGRSACLAVGLFEAVRRHGLRKVRLLELGASAGLNLNVDRYRIVGPGWSWGTVDSPVILDTEADGVRPEDFVVVGRRGCDLSPVDVSTSIGTSCLTSFCWPFDVERHARLATAIEVARSHPVTVDRAPASTWLADQLASPTPDDVLTVVWQSITAQYWPAAEQESVASAIENAKSRKPLAHISLEGVPPVQAGGGYTIAEHGPTIMVDDVLVARSHHHGPPVVLL